MFCYLSGHVADLVGFFTWDSSLIRTTPHFCEGLFSSNSFILYTFIWEISTARYKVRKADHFRNWKMKIFQTKAQFSQSKALIKLNPPQVLPLHVLQQFDWCQTPHGQLQVQQRSQTKRWWTPGRLCWQSPQMDCWKLYSSESSRLLVRMLSLLNHPCRKLSSFSKSQKK